VVVGFVDIQESVSSLDIVEITLNKCRVFAQIIIFSGTQLNNSNLLALRTTLTIIVCVLSKLIIFIPSRVNEIVASVKMSFSAVTKLRRAVNTADG
jgi:hypothetical protein